MKRSTLIQALLASLAMASLTTQTSAQDKYPSRAITLIVPQAPGGANDTIARILAQKLQEQTGQTFVVENKAGAGGNVGTALAAKAKPDGYTLLLNANSAQVINPALYKSPGFDAIKDFEPVMTVATAGYVIVANNAFAPKNVAELIAAAKAQPGKITIASAGNGTLNHLIGEMLGKATGIDMLHIPYKGASAAITDVASGQVQVSVQSVPSSIAFIKSNRVKVLAVVNEKRLAALPEVPTIAETVPGLGSTPWYGLLAPAGTPREVIAWLHVEFSKALDASDVKDKLAAVGTEPAKSTPAVFAKLLQDDLPRWAKIVKDSGASID
jgi:tripartite-type tricarboxylate transporter receptor subunit TctC